MRIFSAWRQNKEGEHDKLHCSASELLGVYHLVRLLFQLRVPDAPERQASTGYYASASTWGVYMHATTRSARSWRRTSRIDAIVAILGYAARPREEIPPDVLPHTIGQIIAQHEQNRCHSVHSGLHGRAARGDPSRCTPPHDRPDHGIERAESTP